MKNIGKLFSFVLVILAVSCSSYDSFKPIPTGQPQIVTTMRGDGDKTIVTNTVVMCDVTVVFDYTDQVIGVNNKTYPAVHVFVYDESQKDMLLDNTSLNLGEDRVHANFVRGDVVRVVVRPIPPGYAKGRMTPACDAQTYRLGQ